MLITVNLIYVNILKNDTLSSMFRLCLGGVSLDK